MFQKIKIPLLVVSVVILLLFSTALLIPLKYEGKIKSILVEQLDASLTVPLKIQAIDLNLLRHFPKASVSIKGIELSGSKDSVTLAKVDKLHIVINLMSLIRNNYIIEKVIVLNSELNFLINEDGEPNYHVFKESSSESKPYTLDLQKVIFKNISISYFDMPNSWSAGSLVDEIAASISIKDNRTNINVSAVSELDSLVIDSVTYLADLPVSLSGMIVLTNDNKQVTADNIEIDLNNNIKISLSGSYEDNLNLLFTMKEADMDDLLEWLPPRVTEMTADYSFSGKIAMEGTVSGKPGAEGFPSFTCHATGNDISVSHSNSVIKHISFKAMMKSDQFNDAHKWYVDITDLYASDSEGELSGIVKINDFKDLNSLIHLKGRFGLHTLKAFFPALESVEMDGKMAFDISYTGKISDWLNHKITGKQKFNGSLHLSDILYDNNDGFNISSGKADIQLSENLIEVQSLSMTGRKSDISFNGKIRNLPEWLIGEFQTLKISGQIQSDYLFIDEWLLTESETSTEPFSLTLPEQVEAKVEINLDKVQYGGITALHVRGDMLAAGFGYVINSLSSDIFNGKITADVRLFQENPDEISLDGNFTLTGIDINQLFSSANNFGQDYITDKHLKGTVNGSVYLNSFWKSRGLEPDYDKLFSIADITVEHGELNNFEPIDRLFGFIKAKQLRNVQFDKLENTILIKDQVITIPAMAIRSNVVNMTMSGDHGFDDHINYQFKVNLTKSFFSGNKGFSKHNVNAEDDGMGGINLFVSMTGTSAEPVIKYNKSAVKEHINEGLINEKKELKNIFNKKNRKKVSEEYEFEWDDGR